jgi:hypothetical protein
VDRDALIAHRRRMGMLTNDQMPETREVEDDCGCGNKVPRTAETYKPRGTKNPRFADYKLKS